VGDLWGAVGSPYLDAGHHLKYTMTTQQAARQLGLSVNSAREMIDSARDKLLQARKQRKLPADNKVLAAWNGLLLHSLAVATSDTGNDTYRQAAKQLYELISDRFWNGKELSRSLNQGKGGGRVSLEDYAYVSQGIISWARASDDPGAWDLARAIALAGLERFHNQNGWQLSESLVIPYNARELVLADHTMPSPSSTLLTAIYDIAVQQKDDDLKQQVLNITDVDVTEIISAPLWYGTHIALVHHILRNL
jgi:uncharacterized protein YyaL (SSP411 family)